MRISFTSLVRYAALAASMVISFAVERDLALSHGVPVTVAPAVPLAIDLYMIWAVRTGRDIALAVSVAVAANVAGVVTTESLSAVGTWVAAGLHAVFPLTIWRMHRNPERPSESLSADPSDNESSEAAKGRKYAAEGCSDDDLWADFERSEADSANTPAVKPAATPPSAEDIRAAVAVLESRYGRPVTGRMVAEHFGVSERTGRRYLAMAA